STRPLSTQQQQLLQPQHMTTILTNSTNGSLSAQTSVDVSSLLPQQQYYANGVNGSTSYTNGLSPTKSAAAAVNGNSSRTIPQAATFAAAVNHEHVTIVDQTAALADHNTHLVSDNYANSVTTLPLIG